MRRGSEKLGQEFKRPQILEWEFPMGRTVESYSSLSKEC